MEVQKNLQIESTSNSLPLTYDCFQAIFQQLGFQECMDLAEAFGALQCIADSTYKRKFNNFTFNFLDPINRVFYHVGPFVQSLTLIMDNFGYNRINDIIQIRDACNDIHSLTLKGFSRRACKYNPFSVFADRLQVLSLSHCSLGNDKDFFEGFLNLKCLNIRGCRYIKNIIIKKCFEENQSITSFTCDYQYLLYKHLLLLPNLERFCLHIYERQVDLKFLSQLKLLKNLSLHCWYRNVNDALISLAETNILEKLELIDVTVDDNTFKIIKQLDKLELLTVTTRSCDLDSSAVLPLKLKSLRLGGFKLTQVQMSSLIHKLENLENIHLVCCVLEHNGIFATSFDLMSDSILQSTNLDTDRKLYVVLTYFGYILRKIIVANDCLRITNYVEKSTVFEITYPGMVDWLRM